MSFCSFCLTLCIAIIAYMWEMSISSVYGSYPGNADGNAEKLVPHRDSDSGNIRFFFFIIITWFFKKLFTYDIVVEQVFIVFLTFPEKHLLTNVLTPFSKPNTLHTVWTKCNTGIKTVSTQEWNTKITNFYFSHCTEQLRSQSAVWQLSRRQQSSGLWESFCRYGITVWYSLIFVCSVT